MQLNLRKRNKRKKEMKGMFKKLIEMAKEGLEAYGESICRFY